MYNDCSVEYLQLFETRHYFTQFDTLYKNEYE